MTLVPSLVAASAVCLLVAAGLIPPPGFWPRALRAAGRLLATLGRYLLWGCGCPECGKARRQARRSHPSARVITARHLDLSEDEAEARWRELEKRLRAPQPRDGGDR